MIDSEKAAGQRGYRDFLRRGAKPGILAGNRIAILLTERAGLVRGEGAADFRVKFFFDLAARLWLARGVHFSVFGGARNLRAVLGDNPGCILCGD